MTRYLLPLFLLAACDQDQQGQRPGEADRNDAEMGRGTADRLDQNNQNNQDRTVGDPMARDRAGGTTGTVGNDPNNVNNPNGMNNPDPALDPSNDPSTRTDNPPFEQSEKPEDIRLTADIRKAVLAADGLSMAADNVQIITREGTVLLRGNVESQAEKDAIEKIAKGASGAVQVNNQLIVKSAQ